MTFFFFFKCAGLRTRRNQLSCGAEFRVSVTFSDSGDLWFSSDTSRCVAEKKYTEQQAKKLFPQVFVPVCNPDGTYSEVTRNTQRMIDYSFEMQAISSCSKTICGKEYPQSNKGQLFFVASTALFSSNEYVISSLISFLLLCCHFWFT